MIAKPVTKVITALLILGLLLAGCEKKGASAAPVQTGEFGGSANSANFCTSTTATQSPGTYTIDAAAVSSLPAPCPWAICKLGKRYCKVGRTWKPNGQRCKL